MKELLQAFAVVFVLSGIWFGMKQRKAPAATPEPARYRETLISEDLSTTGSKYYGCLIRNVNETQVYRVVNVRRGFGYNPALSVVPVEKYRPRKRYAEDDPDVQFFAGWPDYWVLLEPI